MQLSAPIHHLKRQAKRLARQNDLPLHKALDQLARREGFQNWSHLASAQSGGDLAQEVLSHLQPGNLALLGARPGHGKTRLGLELVAQASTLGRRGFFFTLDYHERDVAQRFFDMNIAPPSAREVVIDTSDDISAEYIVGQLTGETQQALIVVDYLQLLDQKRTNPPLNDQVAALASYCEAEGAICVIISQVHRSFDLGTKTMPDTSDIRLPNPLDLTLFDQFFFLHRGTLSRGC